jgi:hypothetical protein
MTKSWRKIVLYLISGEESRPGMGDYWNHVFLAGMDPFKRKLLEMFKILLVIVFVVCMTAAIALLSR